MARKRNDDHIRTITKVAGGKSYCITLPIKIVREMNWESQQRVLVRRRGNKIIIQDNIDGMPIEQGDKQAKFSISKDSSSLTFEILDDAEHSSKKALTKAKKKK